MSKKTAFLYVLLYLSQINHSYAEIDAVSHNTLQLTQAEQGWLAEHPIIRVAADPDYAIGAPDISVDAHTGLAVMCRFTPPVVVPHKQTPRLSG